MALPFGARELASSSRLFARRVECRRRPPQRAAKCTPGAAPRAASTARLIVALIGPPLTNRHLQFHFHFRPLRPPDAKPTRTKRNGTNRPNPAERAQAEPEFDWTPETVGVVDSSFFWGYIVTQIPGGFLAARYPANRVFGSAIATSAFLNMLLPIAAKAGFQYVMLLRIVQGLVEVSSGRRVCAPEASRAAPWRRDAPHPQYRARALPAPPPETGSEREKMSLAGARVPGAVFARDAGRQLCALCSRKRASTSARRRVYLHSANWTARCWRRAARNI